jgi:hypothetical protein
MKTEIVLFGQHFNMASRARRRRLVAVFYGVFGVLLLANWMFRSHTGGGLLTIEFTILVGPILGGYFARIGFLSAGRGLVEPFRAQTVLKYPDSATILEPSTLLHPVVDDDPELRTDERAMRRRDYAHYVAHQFLSAVVAVGFLLEYLNYSGLIGDSASNGLSPASVHRIVYCLLQIAYISSVTLPQAVLLWTEPDMEIDPEAK